MRFSLSRIFSRFRKNSIPQSKTSAPTGVAGFRQSFVFRLLSQHGWLAVGVIAAGFAFWLTIEFAQKEVQAERAKTQPRGGMVEVLVAARDLTAGERASAETIAVRKVPAEWALASHLRPIDFDAVNQSQITRLLKAGHPLSREDFRQLSDQRTSLGLEPGFRAISIAVDEVSSVGGLIQPGDRVDLWSGGHLAVQVQSITQVSNEQKSAVKPARLVAENLRVIATGSLTEASVTQADSGRPSVPYSSITLAVPASVAAAVLGGQLSGRFGVTLRAAGEVQAAAQKPEVKKQSSGAIEILIGGLDGVNP